MNSHKVIIHTDGACKGNPGIGGWGAILEYKNITKEIKGAVKETTNNRMELTAVIEALKALKKKCAIEIYVDSQYVKHGITKWIHNWKTTNYKKVKNVDLWQQLEELTKGHEITWHWVKAHNGNTNNERADFLANLAIEKLRNY